MLSRHELTDANALKIMWAAIALVVTGIVMFLGITALFFLLKSYAEPKNLPSTSQNRQVPPLLLPIKAAAEQKARLAKEKQLLKSYEWLDRDKGIVRIPIEQAIEILLYEH